MRTEGVIVMHDDHNQPVWHIFRSLAQAALYIRKLHGEREDRRFDEFQVLSDLKTGAWEDPYSADVWIVGCEPQYNDHRGEH